MMDIGDEDEAADFEEVAELCIALHRKLEHVGSPEMQMLTRMLLFAVGQEIARHEAEMTKTPVLRSTRAS